MVTEMYRIHSERIINLEYRSVRARLVSFLLTMRGRFGKETTEGLVIEVPLRHQDIASSINASRETASREMSALEKKGWIVARRGRNLDQGFQSAAQLVIDKVEIGGRLLVRR